MIEAGYNSAYWRGFFETFTDAAHDPHLWWLLLPLGLGVMAIIVRRMLPRWRWLHVTVCVAGMLSCASLIFFHNTSKLVAPSGTGLIGIGIVLLLGAILLAALGDGTDQGEG